MVWAFHVVRYIEGRSTEEERMVIERIRERLFQEPFAEVVTRYSDCPENGGDLGYFPRGVMVEEFDAVVFSAPLDELTPVFETPLGFHVALVKDRKKEGVLTLNEVAPQISHILLRQKLDREIGNRLNALRKNATIRGLAR
jgi:parvulin-like peptidyl-prolyl isomerase